MILFSTTIFCCQIGKFSCEFANGQRKPRIVVAYQAALEYYIVQPKMGLKPIFHCDAKLLVLGTFASANAKDSTFALPNAKKYQHVGISGIG